MSKSLHDINLQIERLLSHKGLSEYRRYLIVTVGNRYRRRIERMITGDYYTDPNGKVNKNVRWLDTDLEVDRESYIHPRLEIAPTDRLY